eukprot:7151605-Alexandrium_andersonii.AAC.1
MRGLSTQLQGKPGPSRASSKRARLRCAARPRAASVSCAPSLRSSGERKGPRSESSLAQATIAPRNVDRSGPAARSSCGVRMWIMPGGHCGLHSGR